MLLWDYWPGPEGGAERQCRGLVRELERKGIQCLVITSWSHFAIEKFSLDGQTAVHRFGLFCPVAAGFKKVFFRIARIFGAKHDALMRNVAFWILLPTEWLAKFSFLVEIILRLRKNKYNANVIHVHETSWLSGVGSYLGESWGVPVLCKVRNDTALEIIGYHIPWRQNWESFRRKASFVALHSGLRDKLISKGIPKERISIIPNGVDIPPLASGGKKNFEVVYVGNFSQGAALKGFDVLLKAWGKICHELPEARLTMIGGGDRTAWVRMAGDLGCADSISFVGTVPDPGPFYSRASIFVLPSRHEGMSNALLEAQSWGLPAVVSDIPGNSAVVDDGVTGKIVPVGDAQALATALLELLQDPEMIVRMGIAARERMVRLFSRSAVSDQLAALYRKLLDYNTK